MFRKAPASALHATEGAPATTQPLALVPARAPQQPGRVDTAFAIATRPAGASAGLIDSATMGRLAQDVLGRIEQKLRIERERRGS